MTKPKTSAGLLMYRTVDNGLEFLLVHPGGPYFAKKDDGVWSIPKGEPDTGEDLLVTAQREFEEETSIKATGPFIPLKPIKQKGGKVVHAWAFEGDCDPSTIMSNTFTQHPGWALLFIGLVIAGIGVIWLLAPRHSGWEDYPATSLWKERTSDSTFLSSPVLS